MVVEHRHQRGKSITIFENSQTDIPLYHASVGDIIHYQDGSTRELKDMDEVSDWLKEWYFGDRRWKYDGRRNFIRALELPKHHQLEEEEVRKLWLSGEAMMRNPIKKNE